MSQEIAENFSSYKKTGTFSGIFSIEIPLVLYIAVALFPVLTGADSYLHREGLLPIPYPSLFLLLSIFIPVLIKNLINDHGQKLLWVYQNTARITVPFVVIALLSLFWGLLPEANWDQNGRIIFFIPYHFALLIFSIGLTTSKVIRKYHRMIIFAAFLAVAISIGIDVIYPGTFSVQMERAAGFGHNANDGGVIILLLTIGSINWKKTDFINLLVLPIAGLAIFATLSIGSILLYLIVVVFYISWVFKKNSSLLKSIAIILTFLALTIFVVIPVVIEAVGSSKMFATSNAQNRIDKIINFDTGGYSYIADHGRIQLVKEYFAYVMNSPILGYGTGFEIPIENNPHNIYLAVWIENGIFGLLAYSALLAFSFYHFKILKDTRGMVFIAIVFLTGFYYDSFLVSRSFVGLLGILGTMAYLDYSKAPQRILLKRKLSF